MELMAFRQGIAFQRRGHRLSAMVADSSAHN